MAAPSICPVELSSAGNISFRRAIPCCCRLDYGQNRSRVYRVWRVADWARRISQDNFNYDRQSGSVQILTSGLYLIYSQASDTIHRLLPSRIVQKMISSIISIAQTLYCPRGTILSIQRLILHMANRCTKFKVSSLSRSRDILGD